MHVVLLGPQAEAIDELVALGHTLTVLYRERHKAIVDQAGDKIAFSGFVPAYDCPELAWSVMSHLGVADLVDTVIPGHELAVVSASVLNRLLGLEEKIAPVTAMAGRDKALQKSLWARRGVPTSRFVTVTDTPRTLDELTARLAGLPGPYVVKPPAQGGSVLVFSCVTAADVFEVLCRNPGLRHAVIEEKQDGEEWHFDGTVVEGRVEHLMVSRYLAPLIETKSGLTLRSVAFPVIRNPELYAEARRFSQSAVTALGGRWGVFHLEVFGAPGGFVAGELAWRPPGVLAPLSAQHTIGLNFWAAHARVLTGAEIVAKTPESDSVFGFVCLPVKPGARNGVSQADLERIPGVREVRMKVGLGEPMSEMVASTVCVGMALVEASDVGSCEELIDDAVRRTSELHEAKSV